MEFNTSNHLLMFEPSKINILEVYWVSSNLASIGVFSIVGMVLWWKHDNECVKGCVCYIFYGILLLDWDSPLRFQILSISLCDILGPCNILSQCDIALWLNEQFSRNYINFDCCVANVICKNNHTVNMYFFFFYY